MLYVVVDNSYKVKSVHSKSYNAFEEKPDGGYVIVMPSCCSKEEIQKSVDFKVKHNYFKPLVDE